MADRGIIDMGFLDGIGRGIQYLRDSNNIYLPSQMEDAIRGGKPTGAINITQNGTVDVTQYASANVQIGSIVYVPYNPEYEQGAAESKENKTYEQNKISNATRIRPVDLVDVSQYMNDDVLFTWDTSEYETAWQQYNQAGMMKASSEWLNKAFILTLTYPNIVIIFRNKTQTNILPSEFINVNLKLISLNDSGF